MKTTSLAPLFRLPPPGMDLKPPKPDDAALLLEGLGPRVTQKALGLVPLARDSAGGVYCEWLHDGQRPVVYLGSDGALAVVAKDLAEFYGFHAFPSRLIDDCVQLATSERTLPRQHPRRESAERDWAARAPTLTAEPLPAHLAVLEAVEVPPATNVLAAVRAANDAFLLPFRCAVDRLTPVNCPVFERWYKALDRRGRPPRPYSPTETYARGEVLTHPDHGVGVVVRLVGERIVFAYGSQVPVTQLLACGSPA